MKKISILAAILFSLLQLQVFASTTSSDMEELDSSESATAKEAVGSDGSMSSSSNELSTSSSNSWESDESMSSGESMSSSSDEELTSSSGSLESDESMSSNEELTASSNSMESYEIPTAHTDGRLSIKYIGGILDIDGKAPPSKLNIRAFDAEELSQELIKTISNNSQLLRRIEIRDIPSTYADHIIYSVCLAILDARDSADRQLMLLIDGVDISDAGGECLYELLCSETSLTDLVIQDCNVTKNARASIVKGLSEGDLSFALIGDGRAERQALWERALAGVPHSKISRGLFRDSIRGEIEYEPLLRKYMIIVEKQTSPQTLGFFEDSFFSQITDSVTDYARYDAENKSYTKMGYTLRIQDIPQKLASDVITTLAETMLYTKRVASVNWLHLQNVCIDDGAAELLSRLLARLDNLDDVWIIDCDASPSAYQTILEAVCENPGIRGVRLEIKNIDEEGASILLSELRKARPDMDIYVNGLHHVSVSTVLPTK